MSVELTEAIVIDLATEAIERMGHDHVSPLYHTVDGVVPSGEVDSHRGPSSACRYTTPSGEAGCIVGQILHAHGVPVEALNDFEGNTSRFVIRSLRNQGWSITEEASELLDDLQADQDTGTAWGNLIGNLDI